MNVTIQNSLVHLPQKDGWFRKQDGNKYVTTIKEKRILAP